MNTVTVREITLKDGRRVKEVPADKGCRGCMFTKDDSYPLLPCRRSADDYAVLKGCIDRETIYLPVDLSTDPVAYLWRHAKTGQTRIVEPDCVITTQPGGWKLVGPLLLAQPEPVKRQPLTLEERRAVCRAAEERIQESSDLRWLDAIVEEVERAYGIRQQDGGAT